MKLKLILLVLLYSYFSTAQIPDNFEFLEHNYWGHTMGASCFIDGDFYFVSAGECYSESRLYKIHNNQQPTEVSKLFGSTSKLVTLSDSSAMIITYDESCHLILQGFSTITISPQGLEVNDYYKNGSEENIQCEEILDQLPVSSDIVYSPEKGFYILDEINSKLCFLDMNCQLSCKTSTGAESLFIDNNEDVYMITKSEDRVSILKTNDALDQTLVRTLPFDYE